MPADLPTTPPSDLPPGSRPSPRWFIHVSLVLAALPTVGSIGIAGWQWYNTRLPNTAIIVIGLDRIDDVEVVIRNGENREIARGRLLASNEYRFVVLVEGGPYIVRTALGDQVFAEERVTVPDNKFIEVSIRVPPSLKLFAAKPKSSSRPAAGSN